MYDLHLLYLQECYIYIAVSQTSGNSYPLQIPCNSADPHPKIISTRGPLRPNLQQHLKCNIHKQYIDLAYKTFIKEMKILFQNQKSSW
jgi:hypothetical protein